MHVTCKLEYIPTLTGLYSYGGRNHEIGIGGKSKQTEKKRLLGAYTYANGRPSGNWLVSKFRFIRNGV